MELRSKTIYFRLVEIADAKFILSLRTNEMLSQYLSYVDNDILKQEEWLINYKEREKNGSEHYYIIHRNSDSIPIGTVRIYDFIGNRDSFCWGSWILNENKTRYASLESVTLIYDFAFLELGFKRCHMDIRKNNIKVLDFHKRIGVKIVDETDIDYIGHYYIEDYMKIRQELIKVIYQEN